MSRLLRAVIVLPVLLSLLLPFPVFAGPEAADISTLLSFTTIIRSLSVTNTTIVVDLDALKSPPEQSSGKSDFLSYLRLFPIIEQGRLDKLKIIVLSRADGWKLVLNELKLDIDLVPRPGRGTQWHLAAGYELQHPQLTTSGSFSLELEFEIGKKEFAGRGTLSLTGRTADHRYTLVVPVVVRNNNLELRPELALDDFSPTASFIRARLPAADYPTWKVECSGELADRDLTAALLRAGGIHQTTMLPRSGQVHYDLTLAGEDDFLKPPYESSLQLKAEKLNFQAADGDLAIEDAGFTLDAVVQAPASGLGTVALKTTLHGGPFLWQNYFWDLTGQKASGFFKGKATFRHGLPVLERGVSFSGRVEAASLWSGRLTGRWSPTAAEISFTGQPMEISGAVTALMPEFLDEQPPILRGLATAGHYRLSAVMKKSGDKIAVTTGQFTVTGGDVSSPAFGQLHGLEFSMPLSGLGWNLKTKKMQIDRWHLPLRLKFTSLSSPWLQAGAQDIPVLWDKDRVSISNTLRMAVLGCPVSVANLTVRHPFLEQRRQATAAVAIKPAPAAAPLPALPVSLKISQLIDKVRHHLQAQLKMNLDGNCLDMPGRINFPLFSGQVNIDNLRVRRLFSPSRVIALDMKAEKLDLQQVTALVQAGSATGIIDVELKDFEFSYGQPSKFDLKITSVDVPGIPRKISVEAIENLSLLSSGSGGGQGLLNVGINRFFSHYRYGKIGLYCRLRDDVFQLRGLIHQNGREYIVKRGLLTGIDVVNYNPDNRISFGDMRERVLRIFNQKQ